MKPKNFGRWIGIESCAKFGGMTIGNSQGAIIAFTWGTTYDGLAVRVGGKLMGIDSICLFD